MSINNDLNVDDGAHKTCIDLKWLLCVFSFSVPVVHAETPSEKYHSLKNKGLRKLSISKSMVTSLYESKK